MAAYLPQGYRFYPPGIIDDICPDFRELVGYMDLVLIGIQGSSLILDDL